MDWTSLVTPIIVATVPIIIIGVKKLIPDKLAFLYPIIASALGPALDFVIAKATGTVANPTQGVLMGMAAVGLREIIDQLKKAGSPTV